ncbi:uncharacterized protein LOC134526389 [Chroicocephalus ridibundus]|uniref:uncharacterized protein LOC134526389 n=1 Tax=Chroicocephalus ridibundus TaxID=1192867 RepID=UPI002FDD8E9E
MSLGGGFVTAHSPDGCMDGPQGVGKPPQWLRAEERPPWRVGGGELQLGKAQPCTGLGPHRHDPFMAVKNPSSEAAAPLSVRRYCALSVGIVLFSGRQSGFGRGRLCLALPVGALQRSRSGGTRGLHLQTALRHPAAGSRQTFGSRLPGSSTAAAEGHSSGFAEAAGSIHQGMHLLSFPPGYCLKMNPRTSCPEMRPQYAGCGHCPQLGGV